jgi:siroheme synthase (precorrin-2 oxidase/ferrochelatase)
VQPVAAQQGEGEPLEALVDPLPRSVLRYPLVLVVVDRLEVGVAVEGVLRTEAAPTVKQPDLREQLEQAFPPAFGLWIERLAAIRQEMKDKLPTSDDRQAFWRAALSRDIMELVKAGRLNRAEVMIRHAIIDFRPQS